MRANASQSGHLGRRNPCASFRRGDAGNGRHRCGLGLCQQEQIGVGRFGQLLSGGRRRRPQALELGRVRVDVPALHTEQGCDTEQRSGPSGDQRSTDADRLPRASTRSLNGHCQTCENQRLINHEAVHREDGEAKEPRHRHLEQLDILEAGHGVYPLADGVDVEDLPDEPDGQAGQQQSKHPTRPTGGEITEERALRIAPIIPWLEQEREGAPDHGVEDPRPRERQSEETHAGQPDGAEGARPDTEGRPANTRRYAMRSQ